MLEVLFSSGYMAVPGKYLLPTCGRAGICWVVLHTLCCDYGMGTTLWRLPWCRWLFFVPGLAYTVVNDVVIFLK